MKSSLGICCMVSVLLMIGIFSAGCTSPQNGQSTAQNNPPAATTPSQTMNPAIAPTTPAATPASTIAPTTIMSTATTQTSDILTVTLNSAVKKTQVGSSTNMPGHIFVVLDITIQNNDKNNAFKYTDASFAVFDKLNKNRRIAITSKINGGLDNPLASGTIPLKSKTTGQIVFGEDDNSNSYKLYVSDSTGTVLTTIDNINIP